MLRIEREYGDLGIQAFRQENSVLVPRRRESDRTDKRGFIARIEVHFIEFFLLFLAQAI